MQKRETWNSRTGFILAAVGSAIGLGNIWRFPYMAYDNGGGAFLIPYFVAMLLGGIPFMILEYGLGHRFKGSAPQIFTSISKRWEWLGWWQTLVCFVIGTYYVVIIAWSILYLKLSFTLGWGEAPKDFFFGNFLGLTGGATDLGGVQPKIFLAALAAWGVTFYATFTGVRRGIERLNKIFMPLLFGLVLIFIARVVLLPGATDGMAWLFKPDFSALSEPKVWADAFGQIFFSLSLGFGIMLAYSSYLKDDSDINANACVTVLLNCGFSILAGIMIFSVLGYMAMRQGVPISDVAGAGVGLAFVTMPTAINLMPMPTLFGIAFFLALVVAGISSLVSIAEGVVSALNDKTSLGRKLSAIIVCGAGFAISTVFTTGGGLYLLDIVDHFVNNYGILLGGMVEVALVAWLCDLEGLRNHINRSSDFSVGAAWMACLRFVIPLGLASIALMSLWQELTKNYSGYDTSVLVMFGWAVLFLLFVGSMSFPRKQGAFAPIICTNKTFRKK